jgi:DNA integrity scanning protein DisA with diadenylate cyclase activity
LAGSNDGIMHTASPDTRALRMISAFKRLPSSQCRAIIVAFRRVRVFANLDLVDHHVIEGVAEMRESQLNVSPFSSRRRIA